MSVQGPDQKREDPLLRKTIQSPSVRREFSRMPASLTLVTLLWGQRIYTSNKWVLKKQSPHYNILRNKDSDWGGKERSCFGTLQVRGNLEAIITI